MLKLQLFKKGQGMSLNVIIMAAIALIVLIVLVFIFTGRIKGFGTGLADCGSKGGICDPAGNLRTRTCSEGKAPILNTNCEEPENGGTICCIPVFE
jgi:hypothetical protein